ncbi:MAG: hypothetical protein KGJ84_03325 [Elusimicrobia bacterium]|nr:hypothetical protein [Elusimicrobiota bacterium]
MKRHRSMGRRFLAALVCAGALAAAAAAPARAQNVPTQIHFQGRLTDSSNNPLTGLHSFAFGIYDAPTGGSLLWTESQPAVPVANGVFAVQLGSFAPLTSAVFSGSTTYLQVAVDGSVMLPREQLLAAPYAHETQLLAGRSFAAFVSTDAAAQNIAGAKTFTGAVFVPAPTAPGHAATKAYVDAAGGASLLASTNAWSGQNSFQNLVAVSSDLAVTGILTASSGTFTASGPTQFSLRTSSGVSVGGAGGVYANFFSGSFYGSGAGITGITAAPGGASGQVQFNNGGVSGGAAQLYYDSVNGRLGLGTAAPQSALEIVGPSGAALGFDVSGGMIQIKGNGKILVNIKP